jgi:hypothetical protein
LIRKDSKVEVMMIMSPKNTDFNRFFFNSVHGRSIGIL